MAKRTDTIVSELASRGHELREDQVNALQRREMGVALNQIQGFEGWEVAKTIMQQMVDSSVDDLVALAPGDPIVPQAHAAASGIADFYKKFLYNVNTLLQEAQQPLEQILDSNVAPGETPLT